MQALLDPVMSSYFKVRIMVASLGGSCNRSHGHVGRQDCGE